MSLKELSNDEGQTMHDAAIGSALRLEAELKTLEDLRRQRGYGKPESELSGTVIRILEDEARFAHDEVSKDTLGLSPSGIVNFTEIAVFPELKPDSTNITQDNTTTVIKPLEQLALDQFMTVNPKWDQTKRWNQGKRVNITSTNLSSGPLRGRGMSLGRKSPQGRTH